MSVAADLTSRVFGRLTVLSREPNTPRGRTQWRCKCACGKETVVLSYRLREGKTKSCGCLQAESQRTNNFRHGHNRAQSETYMSWVAMKQRCSNPRHISYQNYGARGIRSEERRVGKESRAL